MDVTEDVAAALQECLDRIVMHICEHFATTTGLRRLALAGGVALNCTANGKLMRSGLFDEIYIQPAAGDDGVALGAALYGRTWLAKSEPPYAGSVLRPQYRGLHGDALKGFAGRIQLKPFASLEETCAAGSATDRGGPRIAWYRGRMEFGPRALGNRSILADPGHPEMRDRINAMVKKREAFRPFAPAVSVEEVHRWFEVAPGAEFPYMIATVQRPSGATQELPAITHVDGARASANGLGRRQSRISRSAPRGRQMHRPRNGLEHQLQREGPTDRKYSPGGSGYIPGDRYRLPVSRRCVDLMSLKGL